MTLDLWILIGAMLLVLSILSGAVSNRMGVPTLVMVLLLGLVVGPGGLLELPVFSAESVQAVSVLALIVILFSGGLDTTWTRIRPVIGRGIVLANVGTAVTAGLIAWFGWRVLDVPLADAFLLGAIVCSTDAAAVFAVLRSGGVQFRDNLEPLIEFESGTNDPIAVFLVLAAMSVIQGAELDAVALFLQFLWQMLAGAAIGLGMGVASSRLMARVQLPNEGLYAVLLLSQGVLCYGVAQLAMANGFLAVYVAGVVLGSRPLVHRRSVLRFHEGLAWLMQVGMFLLLGFIAVPATIVEVLVPGLLVAGFLTFVARPIAVWLSLWGSDIDHAGRAVVSWAGLRGAVPIVLATFALSANLPNAVLLFHLVFVVVIASILLQAVSLPRVAAWLGVNVAPQDGPREIEAFAPDVDTDSRLLEVIVHPDAPLCGVFLMDAGLPSGILVLHIDRAGERLVPHGATRFEAGDRALVLVRDGATDELCRLRDPASGAPSTPLQLPA